MEEIQKNVMINTPCVNCIYLIGERGRYHCKSQDIKLDDDIALGWVGDTLPDCPFFHKRELADMFLPNESLEVHKPKHRKRRKRVYTRPIRVNANIKDTYKEIVSIIEEFNKKKKNKSPSALQIYKLSRFRSKGQVINLLRRMVDEGVLKKNDRTTAKKYTFGFEVSKFP